MTDAIPFSLSDDQGGDQSFPGSRPALICFVKEDCPTCNTVMPVLQQFYDHYQGQLDFLVVGQDQKGNELLIKNHSLTVPILDDSALKVSFA